MADSCCGNCKFWVEELVEKRRECRFDPPIYQREARPALWPSPAETDWCGKWLNESYVSWADNFLEKTAPPPIP